MSWGKARFGRRRIVTGLILATLTASAAPSAQAVSKPPCRPVAFETQRFTVCQADPAATQFRLFLSRADGSAYETLDALPQDGLLFATNAGMFTPDHAPAGLYVEGGVEMRALNTRSAGYGNFHLQPNGVFWMKDGKAHVSTTADYQRLGPAPDLASQSGPMLVIGGQLHPKFEANGSSRYIRNGIGVGADGRVRIAISEEPVSFGVFARLFRDALDCPDALYFDGSVSRLSVAGERRTTAGPRLGPLLGVYAKAR